MELTKAELSDANGICDCVQKTIQSFYPKYYSNEIVDFFYNLHCIENIKADIQKGNVYKIEINGKIVATGCMDENHITRVYVIPEKQHMGIGRFIMKELETKIFEHFDMAILDTSLAAKNFYLMLGYRATSVEKARINDDLIFEYEVMKKSNA